MTIYVAYENQTVLLQGGRMFSYENGRVGVELNALPNEQPKRIIGKKGL